MKITRKIFLVIIGLGVAFTSYSQTDAINDILETGQKDASRLAEYYFKPFFDGYGYGFSNGWYNTAKPHKPLGFDFNISMNVARVPDKARFFTIVESEYDVLQLADPNDNQANTLFGPEEKGPTLTYSHTMNGYTFQGSFDSWQGIDLKKNIGMNAVPAPTIQAGIGLIKNTDLIVRYIPNIKNDINDGSNKVGMFGFGLKHDIKQWIPGIKLMPIDISILGAYSNMNDTYSFDKQNELKKALFDVDNWTVQLLVSKKLSVLTFYGGFGYTSIISKFRLKGTYELTDINSNVLPLTDPIDFKYKNGNYKGTLGMRFKLGVFTLHGDYTFQEYSVFAAGIGVAFR